MVQRFDGTDKQIVG